MIIDSNNPMIPLDKYHNPQKMANPYGTFETHLTRQDESDVNTIDNLRNKGRINYRDPSVISYFIENNLSLLAGGAYRYPQKLLKDAYSNIHPRSGVTITLNHQIRNMKRQQIEKYANEAGLYLKRIHDSDNMDLNPENIWNLPDISKDREYWTDKQGRSHITPDDFLDLKGKSDRHLQWDANFWQKKSIGDQNNKKQMRHDKDSQNEMNWFNYHAKQYAYDSTYPWMTQKQRNKLLKHQSNKMTQWETKFNNNYDQGSKSWLSKINMANNWLTYHKNKLYYYKYYHPIDHKEGIKVQTNLVNRWQKQLNQYIQHKSQDYSYYQKYLQQYRQNKYNEMMNQHWQEICQQIAENMANSFTSIYRADGMDTRVVRVAEITPTEDTSMNVPTKSIDDGMPQNDWVNISQSQLSGQYTIYLSNDHQISPNDTDYGKASPSYNDRVAQYHILKRWGEQGKQLAIEGFNSWHSILISDVSRTADQQSSANGLQMNITFQAARLAHIKYAKNKKAPSRPMQGRHKSSNRSVVIKANDTFSGFAYKYGGTIGEWKRANPHAVATDLQIGSRLNKPKEAK